MYPSVGVPAEDRREFTRAFVRLEVAVSASTVEVRSGYTSDLSGGGMYVVCDEAFAPGTRCRVELYLRSDMCVVGEAVVVRSEGRGMALELRVMDLDGYCRIRDLIVKNAPDTERVREEFREHFGLGGGAA